MGLPISIIRQRAEKALKLAQNGKFDKAIYLYRQIMKASRNNSNAAFMLGALYGKLEQFDDAVKYSRIAAQLDSENVDVLFNLGQAEMHVGDTKEAIRALEHVVRINPRHVEALNNLGFAFARIGEFDSATIYLKRALSHCHNHIDAMQNLAQVYSSIGNNLDAVNMLKTVLMHAPNDVDLMAQLANMYQKVGMVDEAISLYDELAVRVPDNMDHLAGKAKALEKIGSFDEGMEIIEPIVQAEICNSNIGVAFARLSRHYKRQEEAIQYIQKILQNSHDLDCESPAYSDLASTNRSEMHFQLGRLYDSLGKYDQAFLHYSQFNDSLDSDVAQDHLSALMTDTVKSIDMEFINKTYKSSIDTKRPIFIVGMPRSGTTLTEQILFSHPDVEGGGELPDISQISEQLPGLIRTTKPYPSCLEEISQSLLDAMTRRYLNTLKQISDSSVHVTDKMPHNFMHIGLIKLMFPNAKIIHCIRDPMDNCLSIYFSQFNSAHPYATSLSALGCHYMQYKKLMEHWNAMFDGAILEHSYEDLIADQERMTRRLLEYCELDWDPACMSFFKTKRVVNTISYDQVRRPIYTASVKRWKHYEKHLTPLIESLNQSNL